MLSLTGRCVVSTPWVPRPACGRLRSSIRLRQKFVLVSGYYYPTDRSDAVPKSYRRHLSPATCCAASPPFTAVWMVQLMSKIFSPATISRSFSDAIKEMALRPSQLHSSAAESTLMIPNAIETQSRYGELMMPVSIVVGADDRLIKAKSQSMRLHENIPGSALHVIPGIGHMVHHGAPAQVMRAIEAVA